MGCYSGILVPRLCEAKCRSNLLQMGLLPTSLVELRWDRSPIRVRNNRRKNISNKKTDSESRLSWREDDDHLRTGVTPPVRRLVGVAHCAAVVWAVWALKPCHSVLATGTSSVFQRWTMLPAPLRSSPVTTFSPIVAMVVSSEVLSASMVSPARSVSSSPSCLTRTGT